MSPPTSSRPAREPGAPDVAARADPGGAAALAHGKFPEKLAWHCVVRAADSDRRLGDGEWQAIFAEMMHRAGLSEHGKEDKGVRWVAVHHGGNHVHVVAMLARMDGHPVRLHGDWYRDQEAMAWTEESTA